MSELLEKKVKLSADTDLSINMAGDLIYVYEADAEFKVRLDSRHQISLRKGSLVQNIDKFRVLEFFSSVDNTIVLKYGVGIRYEELNASITIDESAQIGIRPGQEIGIDGEVDLSDETINKLKIDNASSATHQSIIIGTDALTTIRSVDTDRKSIIIQADSTNVGIVRIAMSANATASFGLELSSGDSIIIDETFLVTAFNTSSTDTQKLNIIDLEA